VPVSVRKVPKGKGWSVVETEIDAVKVHVN